ncbi:LLM class flavin-dependent oxidoreductase [Saccharibacillus sp. CPCC 101409]|uniref:LLM class flavin-dependent oxidoreductase n=1 Tax=Saccharibacillus sp. CPCC 101409 TaxID=3058041 RepID=UPI0026741B85|nr:LLM class flavin-dependent oxidoreductase [Saccharibacillus sp. CPCC 101409]MDO3413085.1 LLM class flavin-dependent oxidoreductase [Saccharibacillus sp. CPCC 101409]
MSIRLSILDQTPVFEEESARTAFRHSVELARLADRLGYHRYWVSEHHDSKGVAGSSPEVLIAYLLASTDRIRIGSGGVMLQHYSPYKVAENFNVLANLAPGRVDLGIGRAPGGLPRSSLALRRGAPEEAQLDDKLEELNVYLRGGSPGGEESPLDGLRAEPLPEQTVPAYLLGASLDSAELAARLGLPYVFSVFINGSLEQAEAALTLYRERFVSVDGSRPEAILALSAAAADTDEEAEGIADASDLYRILLDNGRKLTVGDPERAEQFGRESGAGYRIEHIPSPLIRGSKRTVGLKLREAAARCAVDELIVTSPIREFAKRLHSYELLQQFFNEDAEQESGKFEQIASKV